MTARWSDPEYPNPRGPLTGDVMAEMDAHLDGEMARLLAAAEDAERVAEVDAAYQLRRAMERHPATRGHVVTAVGGMTRIDEIPPRSPIGTALGTCLGWGLMALGLAVGITPPALSGRTIVGGGLIVLGGLVVGRIKRVTR